MDSERIAITRDGIDILRIIPRGFNGAKLDIKVAVPNREFDIYYYPLMAANPGYMPSNGLQGETVTYHHDTERKPVVIHVKSEIPDAFDGKRYHDVPLHHIAAPSVDGLLPLPIMKVELPSDLKPVGKSKKKRSGKKQFTVGPGCNTVEMFLAHSDWEKNSPFSMQDFITRVISIPFETWSSALITVNDSKKTVLSTPDGTVRTEKISFGDVAFILIAYPQLLMPESKKVRLTFIDNELSEAIMIFSEIFQVREKELNYTCAPRLETLHWPTPMRVNNRKYGDMWVQAIRRVPLRDYQFGLCDTRVDKERTRLLSAILERDKRQNIEMTEMESLLESLETSMPSFEGIEFKTIQRALWLAPRMSKTGYFIFHFTEITDPEGNPVEIYCFFTLGDYDVHFDLARLLAYCGKGKRPRVRRSEGRPFSEGLAELRVSLYEAGYECGPTYNTLMIPKLGGPPYGDMGGSESYAVMSAAERYHRMSERERVELRRSVGMDVE